MYIIYKDTRWSKVGGFEIYLREKDKDLPMASLYLPNKGLLYFSYTKI